MVGVRYIRVDNVFEYNRLLRVLDEQGYTQTNGKKIDYIIQSEEYFRVLKLIHPGHRYSKMYDLFDGATVRVYLNDDKTIDVVRGTVSNELTDAEGLNVTQYIKGSMQAV